MLGISLDPPAANHAFAAKHDFPFRLLSDPTRETTLAYRAVERTGDEFARRRTYVIDAEGRIERALDTTRPGAQAAELLASL